MPPGGRRVRLLGARAPGTPGFRSNARNWLAIGAGAPSYEEARVVFASRTTRVAILGTLFAGVFAWFLRSPVQQVAASIERYPHGRWRLAPFADLNRTVLWVSHIVILHKDSHAELARRKLGW